MKKWLLLMLISIVIALSSCSNVIDLGRDSSDLSTGAQEEWDVEW